MWLLGQMCISRWRTKWQLGGVPFRWSSDSGAEMLDRGRSFRRPFKQRGQFTSRHPPLLGLAFMTFEKRNGTWSKADYDQLC
jgi:hypothetical protein